MPTVKLNVPYRSQWDPDAKDHNADCGPTSLSMLLAALGDPISPDQMYAYIGQRGMSEYTSFGDLTRAAKARNLTMTRKNFLPGKALDELKATLNAGKPFIALVNYAFWDPIVHNGFKGSHFVLVTGYDDDQVFIHDPLFRDGKPRPEHKREQGNFCAYTYEQFLDAWGRLAQGNPNYAALISDKPVGFLTERPMDARPDAPPAKPATLDETTRRRIRAKAAYERKPDPNLDDPAAAQMALATLGDWGATWDTYTVRRGDSLSKIATMFYQDKDLWRVVVYFNEMTHPGLLEVGETLMMPRATFNPGEDSRVPAFGHGGPTG
ncbi:MAG: C39 family peptidase [Chloroflexi bacterium]|nr:C39 family peptidase [Chloroflexota bacterium]